MGRMDGNKGSHQYISQLVVERKVNSEYDVDAWRNDINSFHFT